MVCSIIELCKKLRESPADAPTDFAAGMVKIRAVVGPGIRAKQEPDDMCGVGVTRRILLTTHKGTADYSKPLARMCNGLILEWPTWNVLALPPPVLLPLSSIGRDYDMNEFAIYEIKDGTTVTLYWYADRWCMGSANGIDISNYTWFDPVTTFRTALDEVLSGSCPGFDWATLNKNKSYTIGFRHNKFHPLI